MRRCAGPRVVLRIGGHSRANRIEFHVAHGIQQVIRVERRREKSVLPQMAPTRPHSIYTLSELAVDRLEERVKTIRTRGHDDEMNVVGHQTIGDDFDGLPEGVLVQKVEVSEVVAALEEYPPPVVPTLSDMVGYARKNDAGTARHTETIRARTQLWSLNS